MAEAEGIDCTDAFERNGTVTVKGNFIDDMPLDALTFSWHDANEQNKAGWCQCVKCKNRWNAPIISILDKMHPNGLNAANIDEDMSSMLKLSAICAMLAIPNVLPAKALEANLKDIPKAELNVKSD